jgi:hypothetical protein
MSDDTAAAGIIAQAIARLTTITSANSGGGGGVSTAGLVKADGSIPLTGPWNAGQRIDSLNSNREVNVAEYASGGNGTSGAPWTGWDTVCPWAANTTFRFPIGQYNYSTVPVVSFTGIRLVGEGPGTFLNFTGTGNCWVFDGVNGPSTLLIDVGMQGFLIGGNAAATNGLFLKSVHHSFFRDIRVTNVSAAGFLTNFAVANVYDKLQVSALGMAFTTTPVNGIVFGRRGVNENTTASVVNAPVIENVSGTGIILDYALTNHIINGTSENNARGLQLTSSASANIITGLDLEGNSVEDMQIQGADNVFKNIYASSLVSAHLYTGAARNHFDGGVINGVLVDAGAANNDFKSLMVRNNLGAFADSGTSTGVLDVWDLTAVVYLQNKICAPLTVTGLTVGALTLGSVPFASTSGLIAQNNANFFWDATNHRLGIGTTAPAVALDLPAYNTTNSQLRVGSFEVQPYALNNIFFADNTYYNGSNLIYRNTGYASLIQFFAGGVYFKMAPSGTGAAVATPVTALSITNLGSVVVAGAALATTATDGFLYIPTCAGPPTGVPTAQTGTAPIVFDSTNNFLYVRVGGTWKKSTVYA